MLIKILKILSKGERYSNKSIAKELGVNENLVEDIINRFIQMGYIEKGKIDSCSDGCSCCSNKGCSYYKTDGIKINVLSITDKGKKVICN